MTRGPGRKFEKGNCANPGGRPKKDPMVREFQETSYKDFVSKLQQFGSMPKEELKEIVKDPQTTVFDLVFARILFDAAQGKADARQVLLDRLWGKVKEMEITPVFDDEHNMMRRIPVAELILLARKYSTEVAASSGNRNHLSD